MKTFMTQFRWGLITGMLLLVLTGIQQQATAQRRDHDGRDRYERNDRNRRDDRYNRNDDRRDDRYNRNDDRRRMHDNRYDQNRNWFARYRNYSHTRFCFLDRCHASCRYFGMQWRDHHWRCTRKHCDRDCRFYHKHRVGIHINIH